MTTQVVKVVKKSEWEFLPTSLRWSKNREI